MGVEEPDDDPRTSRTRKRRTPSDVRDARNSRWDAHRAHRREQLIDAALAALEQTGADFGLASVAEHAGVTRTVLYRYFSDRSSLLEAMGDRAADILIARLMPVFYSEASVVDRIRQSLDVYLGFVEASPRTYRFLTRPGLLGRPDVVAAGRAYVTSALASLFRDRLHGTPADPVYADILAHGIVGQVQYAAECWLADTSTPRAAVVDLLTDTVWAQMEVVSKRAGLDIDPDQPI